MNFHHPPELRRTKFKSLSRINSENDLCSNPFFVNCDAFFFFFVNSGLNPIGRHIVVFQLLCV